MKSLYYILILFAIGIILGCSSTKSPEITAEKMKALDALVEQKTFRFQARWARPLTTSSLNSIANAGLLPPGSNVNNIDLTGNSNYFKMSGDSVVAYFPYFGERQLGGAAYNTTGNAIEFEGVPDDVKIDKTEKGYQIKFNIQNNTETYQVHAQLFPSQKGNININSSHRFPIVYTGFFVSEPSN